MRGKGLPFTGYALMAPIYSFGIPLYLGFYPFIWRTPLN